MVYYIYKYKIYAHEYIFRLLDFYLVSFNFSNLFFLKKIMVQEERMC